MMASGTIPYVATAARKRPTEGPGNPAERIRALRQAIGVTQERFAEMGALSRIEMVQLETGKNKASSYATRDALARGADVPVEALAAYLDQEINLHALLSLCGTYASTQWWRGKLEKAERAAVPGECPPTPATGSRILAKEKA